MSIRSILRRKAAQAQKAAELASLPTKPFGTHPGWRKKRRSHGGGNAVRKTMKVLRQVKEEWIKEQGFDVARLAKGPNQPLDISSS